jgi:arginase
VRPILVPYHLDEYLPDLDVPLQADETITTQLPPGDQWAALAKLYGVVRDRVAALALRNVRPVIVSGDCTTSLGTMAGLQHAGVEPAVVWFDAHGDVQTPETTTSGYLGGFPLRLLAGYRPELIAARLGLHPTPENWIVLVGARDLDPPEITYLQSSQISRCEVVELTERQLPRRPVYLHVDLDVIDPARLPGLRFPASGGPALEELTDAITRVLGIGRVAAVGLGCTWYPGNAAAAAIGDRLQAVLDGWGK